ncbi:MAG: hypothetical protein HY507_01495 [Candidatus Zambryskibacteria bacterium]|nr:hypothetical protein [Candidatus Zambryskibacteria bacterium]
MKILQSKEILHTTKTNLSRGFTLLVATIVTSILLLVSFVVVNIAVKQLVLTFAAEESQYAFYSADSGAECAFFWDLRNTNPPNANAPKSAFDISSTQTISCNGQTISTNPPNNQTVPTIPAQPSLIGGGGNTRPTSIFWLSFAKGCAIVRVTKLSDGRTTVDSRGYNTCDTSASRRFERGVTLTY